MEDAAAEFKARMESYAKTREDIETPHDCHAAYILSDFGTDLDAIEPFTAELTGIVDKMKEELANEVRILEGTDVPEYKPEGQNELSGDETKEDQWRTVLLNGSSTIGRTLTSIPGSSSSSCSVRHNSPVSPTLGCDAKFCEQSTPCFWVISDGCGCGTAAMNESSECTVPTTNEPTPGTPSEAK
jgi:hypothetical protein